MDKSGPVYTKAKVMVIYVMGCAICMQLHSHGLVKAYVTDCARVIHSHGLVKNLRHGLHNRDVTTIPLSSETRH